MRFLPTAIHGIIDYIFGIAMLAMPWFVDMHHTESNVFYSVGIIAFIYSLITKYELGLIPMVSMPAHLVIDFLLGISLITAPILLHSGFNVPLYFLIPGLFAVMASLITKRVTGDKDI
jgi:hypothetical protein